MIIQRSEIAIRLFIVRIYFQNSATIELARFPMSKRLPRRSCLCHYHSHRVQDECLGKCSALTMRSVALTRNSIDGASESGGQNVLVQHRHQGECLGEARRCVHPTPFSSVPNEQYVDLKTPFEVRSIPEQPWAPFSQSFTTESLEPDQMEGILLGRTQVLLQCKVRAL